MNETQYKWSYIFFLQQGIFVEIKCIRVWESRLGEAIRTVVH